MRVIRRHGGRRFQHGRSSKAHREKEKNELLLVPVKYLDHWSLKVCSSSIDLFPTYYDIYVMSLVWYFEHLQTIGYFVLPSLRYILFLLFKKRCFTLYFNWFNDECCKVCPVSCFVLVYKHSISSRWVYPNPWGLTISLSVNFGFIFLFNGFQNYFTFAKKLKPYKNRITNLKNAPKSSLQELKEWKRIITSLVDHKKVQMQNGLGTKV